MAIYALLLTIALLQAPTGSIRGTVVNAAGEPLPSARVELTGEPQGPLVTRTNVDGQFVFPNITRGGFRLSIKKEGYVRQELVDAGSTPSGLLVRMQRAATIEGEVRNEDGFPVANILIQALRRGYDERGRRTLKLFSNTLTDDRGVYRLYWLDPGDYYVNASYLPQLPTPVNANADAPRVAYAPTFFPGTNDASRAEVVHVDAASGRSINFKLQRSPAVAVRGTVRSVLTGDGAKADVALTALDESGSTVRYATKTDNKGVFEMFGVNAGTYVLSAKTVSGKPEIGYSKIQVLNIDRTRADVLVGPGVTMGIRLFGNVPPATDLSGIEVSLFPLESHISGPARSVTQNGSLALVNVQPSDYVLRVTGLPANAYVAAAHSGSRDLVEESVSVQYDNPASLDLQLAFDGGQLTGSVLAADGQGARRATVVLVPDMARRHRPDQYGTATSANDGRFTIGGIAPGNYKLFAWDTVETNAWMNTDFLRDYEETGVNVTVAPNSKPAAQIRVISEPR